MLLQKVAMQSLGDKTEAEWTRETAQPLLLLEPCFLPLHLTPTPVITSKKLTSFQTPLHSKRGLTPKFLVSAMGVTKVHVRNYLRSQRVRTSVPGCLFVSLIPRAFKLSNSILLSSSILQQGRTLLWTLSPLSTYFNQYLLNRKMEREKRLALWFCCLIYFMMEKYLNKKQFALSIWGHRFDPPNPYTESQVWCHTPLIPALVGGGDRRVLGAHWTAILAYLASSRLVRHTVPTNKAVLKKKWHLCCPLSIIHICIHLFILTQTPQTEANYARDIREMAEY